MLQLRCPITAWQLQLLVRIPLLCHPPAPSREGGARVSVDTATHRLHTAQLAEVRIPGLCLRGRVGRSQVGGGSVHLAGSGREQAVTERRRWECRGDVRKWCRQVDGKEILTVGCTEAADGQCQCTTLDKFE